MSWIAWIFSWSVRLFRELTKVYGAAVISWAGIDLSRAEADAVTADLAAMVDGFGLSGTTYPRGYLARVRATAWARRVVRQVRSGERTPPLPDARGQLLGLTLANMTPANIARATIEGVLWSLAYGVEVLREQTGEISAITLTGGASQSVAVRQIASAVFGLPIVFTDTFESVAVGAAKQAAWALSGSMPDWPVPVLSQQNPTEVDQQAAAEISGRYRETLTAHFGH